MFKASLKTEQTPPQGRQIAAAAGRRAANLFTTGQLWCAEAVFLVLNKALGGGLPPALAQQLVSGLGQGIGGRGCVCGALNGGALAIGLFLGNHSPGWATNRKIMDLCGRLHDVFRHRFGATCCRTLTRAVQEGSAEHLRRCARHTEAATSMAAAIILEHNPHLAAKAEMDFLSRTDGRLAAGLKIMTGLVSLRSSSPCCR